MNVFVTGATGALGSRLLPALLAAGHSVRAMSRRRQPPGDVDWVLGDLRTGEGLAEGIEGADVVLHAATFGGFEGGKMRMRRAFFHSPKTDVAGTGHLLEHAKRASTRHFLYTSIVGTDRVPLSYYRHKAMAEELVRAAGVPFTIARITQFHSLINGVITYASRFPLGLIPLQDRYQPIDERDAAALVTSLVGAAPLNGLVEFGGPEIHAMEDLVAAWKQAHGSRKRFHNMRVPGGRQIREGMLCTEDRSGTIRWEQWLKESA